jgi:catechol 2,3-dioxygenase-like lactoylglutathione lyase family enzyme
MAAQLNHTIVACHDKHLSSAYLTAILGLPPAQPFAHFMVVTLANGVSLDFMEKAGPIAHQHYAFLVSDAEFDAGLERVKAHDQTYWADPACTRTNTINHHFGGRGFYFEDPDGHLLELITTPYGSEDPS